MRGNLIGLIGGKQWQSQGIEYGGGGRGPRALGIAGAAKSQADFTASKEKWHLRMLRLRTTICCGRLC